MKFTNKRTGKSVEVTEAMVGRLVAALNTSGAEQVMRDELLKAGVAVQDGDQLAIQFNAVESSAARASVAK